MKQRIPQLDGLRGIAILMVFAFHACAVPLLWSGVDLFFVLSGYLITGILLRMREQTAGRPGSHFFGPFYGRRARRILPPYLIFLVVAFLSFPVPWRHTWFWYAFFAANVVNSLHLNVTAMTPLWSLAVEEQFYFVWPWVVRRVSGKALKRTALVIMAAAPVLRIIVTPFLSSNAIIYTMTPFRADLLACGAFIAVSEIEDAGWIQAHRHFAGMAAVAAGALLICLSPLHSFRHDNNTVFFNGLGYSLMVIIFGGTLTWVLGLSRTSFAFSMLNAKPLRSLGMVSYTFYLYHRGILELVERHLHSRLDTVVVSFALTTTIAALSWSFLETRILGKRIGARRQEIPSGLSGLAVKGGAGVAMTN